MTRSVAIPAAVNEILVRHLIRADGDEDLTFALWEPSVGSTRMSALLRKIILPEEGDRQRHGNVSFNPGYLERVCGIASTEASGIAFIHSHPGPGWQDMSSDDIRAEQRMAGAVLALTDLPLVGLTVGSDGMWSARFWDRVGVRQYARVDCELVRVVGKYMRPTFNDQLSSPPIHQEAYKRTVAVWGDDNHHNLVRLRIGIVGLGSVGSIVAESLARMGCQNITLIDFDEVQEHNRDRLLGSGPDDIGMLKIDIAQRQIRKASTGAQLEIIAVPFSVAEEQGYKAALDCDVLFSCVDRPRGRRVLNHIAYSHLIPVVDGGINVRFRADKKGVNRFRGVDWQLQTVGPERPCLLCLGAYDPSDVNTEESGMLDSPTYISGLPVNHHFLRNENVFPFSANLASLEILQLIELVTGIGGMGDIGVQRYRYLPGTVETDVERKCTVECPFMSLTGCGDKHFTLYGIDHAANAARLRQGILQLESVSSKPDISLSGD